MLLKGIQLHDSICVVFVSRLRRDCALFRYIQPGYNDREAWIRARDIARFAAQQQAEMAARQKKKEEEAQPTGEDSSPPTEKSEL